MHNKATDKKPDVSELRADRSDVMVNVAKARACPAPSLLSPPWLPGDALFSGTHTNKTYLKSPAAACQIVCHRSTKKSYVIFQSYDSSSLQESIVH